MSPARLRGIVFDKDGTLYDFNATWGAWSLGLITDLAGGDTALREALAEELGYDIAAGRFRKGSPVIAETSLDVAARLCPYLDGETPAALARRLDARSAAAPQKEAAPLRPLLDGLRAGGYVLGVATNDSEAPARAHLGASGIGHLFDFIAGADSGHGAKPGPGQLRAFCAATGLRAAEVAMIGDSTHDLIAARAAGMLPIAVLTGPAEAADLAPHAAAVLASVALVPDYLERLAPAAE